eukprot:scaffold64617_cov35-Tisochrysis_lutea.AAC.1
MMRAKMWEESMQAPPNHLLSEFLAGGPNSSITPRFRTQDPRKRALEAPLYRQRLVMSAQVGKAHILIEQTGGAAGGERYMRGLSNDI